MSLVGSGQPFSQTVVVPQPPEVAHQQLFMSMSGISGATPVQVAPGVIVVTRRYIPTGAIVVAVIGFFFFFLGLLALLIRSSETLEIRVAPTADGAATTVTVNGVAAADIITRLQGVLMSGRPVGYSSSPVGGLPQQSGAAPQLSPDGRYWWDGSQWRPTTPPDGQATVAQA